MRRERPPVLTLPPDCTGQPKRTTVAHVPVMLSPCLHLLDPRPGEVIVDGTLGDGGHAAELAAALGPTGRLIALDRDPWMIERAETRLAGSCATFIHANFSALDTLLHGLEIGAVDGILLDLGLASPQISDGARGFAYRVEGPLDMRMTPKQTLSAGAWINKAPQEEIARVIRDYGQERFFRRIARAIVTRRQAARIRSTTDLAEIIRRAVPAGPRRLHPARRTFQAIRIFVNREIDHLEKFLDILPRLLNTGGRCVIISYHSLEDRPVKLAFLDGARKGLYERLTHKPMRPSDAEVRRNPQSRSAKVRAVRRLCGGETP